MQHIVDGGGYGTGQGNTEFWELLGTNANGFILVLIQYRLGAFGFLSSGDMVSHGGIPNLGLHDIHFSLKWVQDHIEEFGGDKRRVTVSGESSGAGAVMLLTMANGGDDGNSLFNNAIVASPYLPTQWDFNGSEPTQAYHRLATEVGCAGERGRRLLNQSTFECLVGVDSFTMQNASAHVSSGRDVAYGHWAFLPVTDGAILQERPSVQLAASKVNGLRLLSGVSRTSQSDLSKVVSRLETLAKRTFKNNANEGPGFVPQDIKTASDFDRYMKGLFPLMSTRDLEHLDKAYLIPPTIPGPLYSTLGSSGPTALNQSEYAIGQQQRANNLYAETTIVCPSYWLASAYSRLSPGKEGRVSTKQAWKYQFSVPPSEHGADLNAYQAFNREALGEGTMNEVARRAVQLAWGRFIIHDDPTLPADVVRSLTSSSNGSSTRDDLSAIMTGTWPAWSDASVDNPGYRMLNINMTGGKLEVLSYTFRDGTTVNVTQMIGPGLEARFQTVDAWAWEGARGPRCELWKDLGASVPE